MSAHDPSPPPRPPGRCPGCALTLLALAFAAVALANAGRAWQALQNVSLLAAWRPPGPSYAVAAVSVAWALLFLVAAWALLRRAPWGRRLALWLPPLYGLTRVAAILLTAATPYARGGWLPTLLGWGLAALLVALVLGLGPLRRCFRPRRPAGADPVHPSRPAPRPAGDPVPE
jgi:hypothetical protein